MQHTYQNDEKVRHLIMDYYEKKIAKVQLGKQYDLYAWIISEAGISLNNLMEKAEARCINNSPKDGKRVHTTLLKLINVVYGEMCDKVAAEPKTFIPLDTTAEQAEEIAAQIEARNNARKERDEKALRAEQAEARGRELAIVAEENDIVTFDFCGEEIEGRFKRLGRETENGIVVMVDRNGKIEPWGVHYRSIMHITSSLDRVMKEVQENRVQHAAEHGFIPQEDDICVSAENSSYQSFNLFIYHNGVWMYHTSLRVGIVRYLEPRLKLVSFGKYEEGYYSTHPTITEPAPEMAEPEETEYTRRGYRDGEAAARLYTLPENSRHVDIPLQTAIERFERILTSVATGYIRDREYYAGYKRGFYGTLDRAQAEQAKQEGLSLPAPEPEEREPGAMPTYQDGRAQWEKDNAILLRAVLECAECKSSKGGLNACPEHEIAISAIAARAQAIAARDIAHKILDKQDSCDFFDKPLL